MNRRSHAAGLVVLALAGCAQVSVQGGDKPIHIVADINVNVRVSHELNDFFAFEDKQPGTATVPATRPS